MAPVWRHVQGGARWAACTPRARVLQGLSAHVRVCIRARGAALCIRHEHTQQRRAASAAQQLQQQLQAQQWLRPLFQACLCVKKRKGAYSVECATCLLRAQWEGCVV